MNKMTVMEVTKNQSGQRPNRMAWKNKNYNKHFKCCLKKFIKSLKTINYFINE